MKIFKSYYPKTGELRIDIVDMYNRNVGSFSDTHYESSDASNILKFIEFLDNEGLASKIEIIESNKQ